MEEIKKDVAHINEVGYVARMVDTTMSTKDRMKIKKNTILRLSGAILLYTLIMIFFSFIL